MTPQKEAPAATGAKTQILVAPWKSDTQPAPMMLDDTAVTVKAGASPGPRLRIVIDPEQLTCEFRPEATDGGGERLERALAHALDDSGLVGRLLRLLPSEELFRVDGLFRMPGFGPRVNSLRHRG